MVSEGQYKAYEVNRIKDVSISWGQRQFAKEYIATLWDKDEAKILNGMINGEFRKIDGAVKKIGVIVLGSDAYYDTMKPPVPAELIQETAVSAVAQIIELDQVSLV